MQSLAEFKIRVDREISKLFDRAIEENRKNDRLTVELLKYAKKMTLAGGKRLRPALMYYGYKGVGGKDEERIMRTVVSVELIHMFLLVHDDIIDRGQKRHGLDTFHNRFGKLGQRWFGQKDYAHFGTSIAVCVGDMLGAMGNQALFDSGFDPDLVIRALYKLQKIVALTVVGEIKDVFMEYKGRVSEEEIMKMYEFKTACYTFEGPLNLGMTLGGGDEKMINEMKKYAIPIGIAFQIQDDILGVFGSEKKMGKDVGGDIEEGKQTILIARAIKKASRSEREFIRQTLGQPKLTKSAITEFKSILERTGSLDYARNLSRDLTLQGKAAIMNSRLNPESKQFLLDIAEHLLTREV